MAVSDRAAELRIERLEPRHAEGVAPLSVEAGWNQIAADWRLMIELGRAFGVRDAGGTWVASALVLPLGPAISWISMVLVTAPARRRGLGTRLLNRCLAAVEESGTAAGLDATELGRPVYLPLGFRDVYPLSRWRLEAGPRRPADAPPGVRVRPAEAQDLPRIIACDGARSGFARGTILEHLLSRAPELARVAERSDGRLAGYALGRNGHAAMHIGPVVADDEAIGLSLLSSAVAQAEQRVILDVPDRHQRVRQWLTTLGGSAPRTFMRMLCGACPAAEDAACVFALAGPELA
jgi:ribosomal protein S18 acetylase RimI-like enzyme